MGQGFHGKRFLLLLFPNNGGFPLVDLAAVLIGGILPAVLTLRLKIHTEKYLIKRLIIIVVIFAVNRFIRNLLVPGNNASYRNGIKAASHNLCAVLP